MHDDAAVHGIFAAAKAAGATGASVRYGGVLCKVWFEPHGSDTDVADKVKEVQQQVDDVKAVMCARSPSGRRHGRCISHQCGAVRRAGRRMLR